jgi:carbonic anhydrase
VEQVLDLSKTSIIQNSWHNRSYPALHGWVYSLKTGLIKDLNITLGSSDTLPDIYRIANIGSSGNSNGQLKDDAHAGAV